MNSKIFIFLLVCLFGCGVKSNPVSPPEKAIPSYIESYTDDEYTVIENSLKVKK